MVEFQTVLYGDEVSSDPRLDPSNLNWTPETPTLSLAVAVTETEEPLTVEEFVGAVRETEGEVVSGVVVAVEVPVHHTKSSISYVHAGVTVV